MDVAEREETREGARDRELMAAFYDCSEGAFEGLADRWWPRLFGFFRRLGAGVEDAEDLALQTLVKLYSTKERRSFDLERPLAPFLFTMARRVHIAWLRELDREPKTGSIIEALDLASPTVDLHPELSADVFQCIQALPEDEQLYVTLCGLHGLGDLSHNEIAAVMEKWPAQVTRISKRTRVLLKRCLETRGFGDRRASDPLVGEDDARHG